MSAGVIPNGSMGTWLAQSGSPRREGSEASSSHRTPVLCTHPKSKFASLNTVTRKAGSG